MIDIKISKQKKQKVHQSDRQEALKNRFIGCQVKVLLLIQQQISLCALKSDIRYFVVQHYFSDFKILLSYQLR